MKNHDLTRTLEEQKQLIGQLSPKFEDLTADFDEILSKAEDPKFVAGLLFKLAMERQQANKLLESINDKFDKIMFELKTTQSQPSLPQQSLGQKDSVFEVLPEQDNSILSFIEKNGKATAEDIQKVMNYKGLNAASQRLNKLFREGYLKKVQSGKKVLFLTKN